MQVSARFRWKNRTGILIFFRFWMDICSYYPFFCRIVFPLHQKRSLLCRKDLFLYEIGYQNLHKTYSCVPAPAWSVTISLMEATKPASDCISLGIISLVA